MADAGANFLQSIAPLVATINSQYPQLAAYLQDPEIAQIILDGAAKGQTPTEFQGALQSSNWFKTKPPSERQWIVTKLTDPGRAAQLEAQTSVQIRQVAASFGVPLNTSQMDLFVNGALQGGWDANEIQRRIVDFSNNQKLQPGQILATQDQLKNVASSYAIPISDGTLGTWAKQINDGSQTTQGFQSYAQQQAKLAFPSLSKQIDSGLTVKQIGDPYAQIAAQQLGVDPNTIDWTDPKWQAALQGKDAQGNITGPMTHLAWSQHIMTTPTYGYATSQQGQTDAYSLMNTLKQGFGIPA